MMNIYTYEHPAFSEDLESHFNSVMCSLDEHERYFEMFRESVKDDPSFVTFSQILIEYVDRCSFLKGDQYFRVLEHLENVCE